MFLAPLNHDVVTLAKVLWGHNDFVWLDSNGQGDFSLLAWGATDAFSAASPQDGAGLARFLRARARFEGDALANPARLKFVGGWLGYFAYEAFALNPLIPFKPLHLPDYPLAHWRYYDTFVYLDHTTGKTWFAGISPHAERRYNALVRAATLCENDAGHDAFGNFPNNPPPMPYLTPCVTRARYDADFDAIKRALARGDYFELNYTMGFDADYAGSALALYLPLRQTARAPHMAFWRDATFDALSASPECFFRIEAGCLSTFPIKGTAARGSAPAEDNALKTALAHSPKERAELLMVTDMLRNDLGRVCRDGSVITPLAVGTATFTQCHHLYSEIRGTLRDDATLADVFHALFPGGSITGAPKIQVMRDINRLEARARGIYTGAIGLISDSGFTEFNIPIRTLTLKDGRIEYAAGGGIVADSACDREYAECLLKTNIVGQALAMARERAAA